MGIADRMLSRNWRARKLWGIFSVPARSQSCCASGYHPSVLSSESNRRRSKIEPPVVRSVSPVHKALENLLLGSRKGKKAASFSRVGRCFSTLQLEAGEGEGEGGKTKLLGGGGGSPRISSSAPPPPWLMLRPGLHVDEYEMSDSSEVSYDIAESSEAAGSPDGNEFFHFFSLVEGKVVKKEKMVRSPWERELLCPEDARCVGSSHGWLAFIHPRNCSVYLLNPFLCSPSAPYPIIPLPPFETLPALDGSRVYRSDWLSSSPTCLITEAVGTFNSTGGFSVGGISIRKLVLSSAPSLPYSPPEHQDHDSSSSSSSDCTAMAIQGRHYNRLAFCKPGGKNWTGLKGSPVKSYWDIVYFKKDRRFYAIAETKFDEEGLAEGSRFPEVEVCDRSGLPMGEVVTLEAWDLSDPCSPKMSSVNMCPYRMRKEVVSRTYLCIKKWYLVESCGELLLVVRYLDKDVDEDGKIIVDKELEAIMKRKTGGFDRLAEEYEDYKGGWRERLHRTDSFDVYKFDFDKKKWDAVECLGGDRALFVGLNHSFSISISTGDYPEMPGNAIYFTDDHLEWGRDPSNSKYGGHDLGVFKLDVDEVTTYLTSDLLKIRPPPVYVVPSPAQPSSVVSSVDCS